MMEEQIESFESFDASAAGIHDNGDTLPCPLCHFGFLSFNPSSSGILYCRRPASNENSNVVLLCKLARGACFEREMMLANLRMKLMGAYEEHARLCTGALQFDLQELDGKSGLITGCNQCLRKAMIAPAAPIQRR